MLQNYRSRSERDYEETTSEEPHEGDAESILEGIDEERERIEEEQRVEEEEEEEESHQRNHIGMNESLCIYQSRYKIRLKVLCNSFSLL